MTPRRYLLTGGIGLALLASGYAGGRYAQPARVETHETVRTVEVTKTVTVAAKAVQLAEATDTQRHVVLVREWATDPNCGTHVTRETSTDLSTAETRLMAAQQEIVRVAAERSATAEASRSSVTTYVRPQWHVELQPGLDLRSALQGRVSPTLGASVQRRLLGPLWGGLWGSSAGSGGVSVGVEF